MSEPTSNEDLTFDTDTEGTWAISYGDLLTLLLTFFIIFFNTNRTNEGEKAIQSEMLKTITEKLKSSVTPSSLQNRGDQVAIGDSPKGKAIQENLVSDLGARIGKVGTNLFVDFQGVSFFDLGRTDVTSQGKEALRRFVQAYLPYAGQHQLSIRAFTDNTPVIPTIKFSDNLELSALRAVHTLRILQKLGLPLLSMKLGGYGELNIPGLEPTQEINRFGRKSKGVPLARRVILMIEPLQKGTD